MQEQLGVAEPDFGVLLESMVLTSGARLATDTLIAPRVEAEFAVRMSRDLSGRSVTLAETRAAIGEVMLALEIIDSRIVDWRIRLADTIADNASSALVVLGPPRQRRQSCWSGCPTPDLTSRKAEWSLTAGGGPRFSGIRSKQWCGWSDRLNAFGESLKAGDVVMTGAVHASRPIVTGAFLSAASVGFEAVSVFAA